MEVLSRFYRNQTNFSPPFSKMHSLLNLSPRKQKKKLLCIQVKNHCAFGQFSSPPLSLRGFSLPFVHNLRAEQQKQCHHLLQFHRKLQFLLALEAPLQPLPQTRTGTPCSHTAAGGGCGCTSFRNKRGGEESPPPALSPASGCSILTRVLSAEPQETFLFHTVLQRDNSCPTILPKAWQSNVWYKRFVVTHQERRRSCRGSDSVSLPGLGQNAI